jgi:hypothetical protein
MPRIARSAHLLALLVAVALAAPAGATDKPHRKHGKRAESAKVLPKQWVKRHKAKGAKADPDHDGLSNWGEYRSRTNPKRADSDRDGLGDAGEDRDRDRLDNGSEEDAGTDPARRDSDGDRVRDDREDSDADGLANGAEDHTGHDPGDPDTDGDGIRDGKENAGDVQAFDGTTLTIALAIGGSLTATVDHAGCDDTGLVDDAEDADEDDSAWEDEDAEIFTTLPEEDDEDEPGDEDWVDEDDAELGGCDGVIAPGDVVHQASVEDGVFVELDLLTVDE